MTDPPTVPYRLDDALIRLPLVEVARERALVRFPGVGRIVVDAGGSRRRQVDPGRSEHDLDFLDDTVHAMAEALNGVFCLRASVVAIDGSGVALCGYGPTGKSTVAAALARRGYEFVCDSVARVDVTDEPIVAPRAGGPVLWPDAVATLGLDPDDGVPVRAGLPVRRFELPAASGPVPLTRVVIMRDHPDEVYDTEVQRGFDAVDRVRRSRWHGPALAALDLDAAAFFWSTRLATAATVVDVTSPRHRADPERVADLVVELMAAT